MSDAVYAVYEIIPDGKRLRALFPPDAAAEAIAWGENEFEVFHAATPRTHVVGEGFLTKTHGVHIHDDE